MTRKPRSPAWMPVHYEAKHVEAVQACLKGIADEHQQKLAIEWVIIEAAGTRELSFRSDADGGDRETAFAEGRRFVGLSLAKMAEMSPKMIAELRKQNG